MPGALDGQKVLEIGQWMADPFCRAIPSDLGADVIKVGRPGRGEDQHHSPSFGCSVVAVMGAAMPHSGCEDYLIDPRFSSNGIRIDSSLVLEELLETRLANGRPQITFTAANAGLARIANN